MAGDGQSNITGSKGGNSLKQRWFWRREVSPQRRDRGSSSNVDNQQDLLLRGRDENQISGRPPVVS